ncbi:MAG: hypothetical protein AAB384_00030 [Patescibacteria group bacterium]
MVEVKRKKGESFEAFMRRFRTVVKMSGISLQAKKIQFFGREKNKTARNKSAVTRVEQSQKRAWLMKTGQLKEEEHKGRRR